jgi:hypothetical protein
MSQGDSQRVHVAGFRGRGACRGQRGAADLLGELGVGSASVVGPFGLAEPCGGIFR